LTRETLLRGEEEINIVINDDIDKFTQGIIPLILGLALHI
jgi:hypothetical protein